MPTSSTDRRRGSSLLECVAAIAILGTALVAGISMFGMHQEALASERGAGLGEQLLRNEFENLRITPYDELAAQPLTPFAEEPDYSLTITMSELEPGVRRLTVIVSWTAMSGTQQKIAATSLRCKGI